MLLGLVSPLVLYSVACVRVVSALENSSCHIILPANRNRRRLTAATAMQDTVLSIPQKEVTLLRDTH